MNGTSVRPAASRWRTGSSTGSRRREAPASAWRTVGALARLEGRRLVRHPVVLAGVALAILGVALFAFAMQVLRPLGSWEQEGWTVLVGCSLLGLFSMVATNLAALRDRRERTEEQHRLLPAAVSVRTASLVLSALWPAAVASVLLGAAGLYAEAHVDLEAFEVLELAGRPMAVATLGTLGIALARWFPHPFVAPLAAWGLLLAAPGDAPAAWHVLSPFATIDALGLVGWHIAYLAGLFAMFAAAALLRDGPRLGFMLVGALGLVLAGVSLATMLPNVCPPGGPCLL